MRSQPVGRRRRQHVQRVAQCFSNDFKSAHGAHRPKDVRGVAALAPAALQQPAPSRQLENGVEEPALRPMRKEAETR